MNRLNQAIDKIMIAGLSIAERKNNSDSSKDNNHMTIVGGIRRVELWTNGTIYANKVNGKFKKLNFKGMHYNEAIDRAIKIAKTGRF